MKVKNISLNKVKLGNQIIYPNQIIETNINCNNLIHQGILAKIKDKLHIQNSNIAKISNISKSDNQNIELLLNKIIDLLQNIQITQVTQVAQVKEENPKVEIQVKENIKPIQSTGDGDMDLFLSNLLENSER